MDVRKMHLDCGDADGGNGVPKRHAGVGVRSRVEDDDVDFSLSLLNPSHKLSFYVGLTELDLGSQNRRPLPDHVFDVLQCYLAVHARLTLAEQIQIGTIKHQDAH